MTNQQITVDTTVAAPVEDVWSAYTCPEDITQWNFANGDWCCPRAEVDLRPGGKQIARMEAKDGSMAGAPMMILTGGPHYKLTPAASISVLTEDQDETDRLWDALTANGGEEGRCGVSWQIVPKRLPDLLASDDPSVVGRVSETMMQMGKIDITALEAAAEKEPAHG